MGDAQTEAALAIADSFGGEWEQFDYDKSRTWHETIEDRCNLFSGAASKAYRLTL